MANSNLNKAKKEKNDEFYTRIEDIENELYYYRKHFKNKIVYCNCDDYRMSNFFKFFSLQFEILALKKLICTGYNKDGYGVYAEYNGEEITYKELRGNGSYDSEECLELLKEADIVVTNPPFSLFRDYVSLLEECGKQYLIVGNKNAITYKEIFPLIKENKLWLGVTGGSMYFIIDDETKFKNIKIINDLKCVSVPALWFTNLDINKRHETQVFYKKYTPEEYPKYDNYDAINVDKTCDIPEDYMGEMGVPITFLNKYNPEHFSLLGIDKDMEGNTNKKRFSINGKTKYARLVIKRK